MTIKKVGLLTALTIFSLGATIFGSFAWFANSITMQGIHLNGDSAGAYFAYGDGKPYQEDSNGNIIHQPYGITETRHLNNLAWLQYNGLFDDNNYYFELASDINTDGSTYVMPPIGTEDHPFIGVFNGNNHTINNIKISNDTSSSVFTNKPNKITYNSADFEVVGFFGVVGKLSGESYNSSVNNLTNFTLNNLTIESKTANTLIGLAAGYVNAEMSGVKVGSSKLLTNGNSAKTAYTTNLSDYGLVGYTTKKGMAGTFKQTISQYYDSASQGDDAGWGGTIVIKDLYERLGNIRSNYAKTNQTVGLSYDDVYDTNGDLISHDVHNHVYNNRSYEMSATLDVYNDSTTKTGVTYNSKIGAVQMQYGSSGIYYLSGGHYSTAVTRHYYDHLRYYISDGTNYLTAYLNDSGSPMLKNVTDEEQASLWNFTIGSSGKIYTIIDSTNYYIYLSDGLLSIDSATPSDNWTINEISSGLQFVNGNYHLMYDSGWVARDFTITSKTYYHIYDATNGRYFKPGGTDTTNPYYLACTTNSSEQIEWYYDSSYGAYYYIRGSQPRFLMYYNSNSFSVIANNSYSSSSNFFTFAQSGSSGNKRTGTFRYNRNYIYYTGLGDNGWKTTTTQRSATTFTIETFTDTFTLVDNIIKKSTIEHGPDYYDTALSAGMDYSTYQDVTYIPLTVENNYEAKLKNTGYIVGGSTFTSAGSYNSSKDASEAYGYYGYGNVRISSFYTISDSIKNYDTTNKRFKANQVWTVDGEGIHKINDTENTYQKYTESKGTLEAKLSTGSTVYGLHFMSATINKDNVVNANYAAINGEEFDEGNYQMPANSIDFNLKDQGYINFFAGTYGNLGSSATTVDSFFSLHQIKRNGYDIEDINEIEEIWGDGKKDNNGNAHSYVYKLSNGQFTVPYSINRYNSKIKYVLGTTTPLTDTYQDGEYTQIGTTEPTGYTKLFDMGWLKNNSYYTNVNSDAFHQAFYFEIPSNPGEYALGTVSGKTYGAYLIYLDIGANAANQDTITAYAVTTFQAGVQYPLGVDFNTTDVESNNGGETLGIIVLSTSSGEMNFTVSGTKINYTCGYEARYAYSEKAVTVNGQQAPPLDVVIPSSNGLRYIYAHINATTNNVWDIVIEETLDAQGEAESTRYVSIKCDGQGQSEANIPESLILNSIKPVISKDVCTIERTTGRNTFDATAEYSGDNFTTVRVSFDATGIGYKVHTIKSGYSVIVNGTTITTDPQNFPAA